MLHGIKSYASRDNFVCFIYVYMRVHTHKEKRPLCYFRLSGVSLKFEQKPSELLRCLRDNFVCYLRKNPRRFNLRFSLYRRSAFCCVLSRSRLFSPAPLCAVICSLRD